MIPIGVEVIDLTDNSVPEANTAPAPEPEPTRQDSPLLGLPLEVLQTITWYMDAGTFFASLLTCKQLFEAAKCRPNLLRHLYNFPGLRLGLEDISTSGLLLRFRKRAAENACAAGVLADITTFSQTSQTSLSNAAFAPTNPSRPGSPAHLATVHDGGTIHIHDLGRNHVRLEAELHIRPEDGNPLRMEVHRLAFSPGSHDLAVLYRHIPCQKDLFAKGGLINHRPPRSCLYKLVTFHHVHTSSKGFFYDSHLQETRDITRLDIEVPVGLALASNGHACIAWKAPGKEEKTDITLVGRDETFMQTCSYDESPDILRIRDPSGLPSYMSKDRQIFSIEFVENDKKLNLFKPGHPVHSWYTATCSPADEECGPLMSNTARIALDPDESVPGEAFAVGMPFYGAHFDSTTVDWQTAPLCQTSYLALGINKQGDDSHHAYIVQANSHNPTIGCDHQVNLDQGRKHLSWTAVALLAGWRQGTSSLGTVVAISPEGTRLAAATWSRVLMWSFSPKLLVQGELQHYFPTRDFNLRKDFGRLRPTLLPSGGVVHNMQFTDETHLYATTDQGLVKWDLGHLSHGGRYNVSL